MATIVENFEGSLTAFSNTGNWTQTTNRAYNGAYSFRSAVIGHSTSTSHYFDITIPEGATNPVLSLWYYVSSESNYDWLRIFIQGAERVKVSGTQGWTPWNWGGLVPGNTYTLEVRYTKDGSATAGDDAVYIDNLQLTYTDPPPVSINHTKTVADTLSLVDNVTPKHTLGEPPTDGWDVYLWDQAKFDVILKKHTIGDTISLADALAIKVKDPNADTTTLSDNVNKTIKNVLADSVNVTDDLIKTIKDVTDEAVSVTDDLRKTIKDITDDTLSLTDAIQAKAQLQIAEALSLLDALAAAVKTSFSDSVGVGDEGIPRLMVLFQEAVAVSDSILALFQAVFGDSLAVQDLLANRVQDQLGDDAVTSSDNLTLKAQPGISDTVALADAVATAVAAYRSDVLNLADQLAVATKATQADTLNLLDAIATAVGKKDLDSATSLADDLVKKWGSKFADFVGSENRVPGFEYWNLFGGTYVDSDGVLQLPNYGAGAVSPMIPIERKDWVFSADYFSVEGKPSNPGVGGYLQGSDYWNADGVAAYNDGGYTGNGNAVEYPLNTWTRKGWGYLGGNNVAYMRINIQAEATYTAPSFSVRNPTLTTTGSATYSPYGVYDEIAKLVGGKSGSDSAATADAIVARVQDYLDDLLTLVDSAKAKASDRNDDTTTSTDALAIVTKRLLADTLSLADSIASGYGTGVLKPGTFDFGKFDESNFDDTGDPISLEDAIEFKKGFGTLGTDLLTLADAIQVAVKDILADNLAVTDSTSAKVKDVVGDTLTLADDTTEKTGKNDGDTSTVSDNIGNSLDMPRTAGDSSIDLSDSSSLEVRPNAGDLVSVGDSDEGKTIGPGPGDTTGVGDTASFSFKKDLDDLLILSDSLLRSVAAIVGDTLPVADQLTLAAKAVAAEIALSLADDNKLKAMTLLGDLMALSDDHVKDIAKTIDDVGTVNDALANRIGAILNSVTTLADTFALSVTLGVVDDIIGVADSIDNITRLILGSSFDMASWDSAAFDTTGDLAAIADSISLLISLAIADGLTVDDDTKAAIKLQYNEAINLVDSILGLYAAALNSNLPLSDMIGLKNMKTLADTVALADILANKYEMAELQEAIDLVEDLILKAKVTGSEMVDLQDTIDMVAGFGTSIDDTVGLSDTSYIEARKQLADILSLVNTLQTKAKLPIDEAIAAADILGVMTRRDAADTIDLMDEIARLYRYVLGGSWDSSSWDGGQFDTSGDSILVEDGYRFALSTLLQEAIATNDTLKTKVGITLADNSDIMDQILNGIMKSAAETMGMSDELLQLIVGLRKDTSLSLAELLSKRAGLPPDDSSTVADSIIAALLLARSADDLIAATDEAIAKVKSMLQDAAVLTDSLALSTKRGIAEAIATAEALGLKTKRPVSSNGVGIIDELYLKYALGIAWDEEGIADSIRGKVKTLLQQVFINGISIPVNGLNLRHSGKDRVSTATFKIPSPNAEILNLAKQRAPVNIYLVDGIGNTDYFGGRIIGNPTSARGSITTEMDITVDDWTSASLDVYVSESFTADSGTISEILKYLWEKYYGYSINLDKIVATTKRMPTQVFNYVSLFEVTERLAQLLGWSWHVEWNGAERILQFYPPSAAIHPVTLSRESKNIVAGTARFGQDDNLANVVYVFGGQGMSNPYTQKIVTDGQNTIYKLGSKPYRLGEGDDGGIQVNIIQGGVKAPLRVGIQNLHDEQLFDVMLDFNEGTLRFRENNIPIKDAILEAIYRFRYPIMVQLTDDSSIRQYGRIETSITDTSLLDVVAARELGRAILRDRAYPKGFGSCEVFVPGLRAGQFITVDLPAYNTKGLFEITEIEKWIQGGVVRRRVTLNKADNAESRIAQRLKDFAKRLASLESSNRQEDMVVQRWLQGPANIGTKVTGRVEGQIEESVTDNIQLLQDDYVLTWKTAGRSKTWAKDSHPLSDDFAKKAKPKNNEVVPATSKITGGISFFDTHTFGDSSHPFGL
jgi:archaellum component FlaC